MHRVEDLINDVFTELRYASGRDVQVHLQSFVGHKIAQLYRTLSRKFTFRDYLTTEEVQTTEDGFVLGLSNRLQRFGDLVEVFNDREIKPLPYAMAATNVRTIRTPTVVATNPAERFRVYPNKVYDLVVVYKQIDYSTFTMDTMVNYDRDLLVLGTASELASASGVNQDRTDRLTRQFDNLLDTLTTKEMQTRYAAPNSVGGIPERWHIDE